MLQDPEVWLILLASALSLANAIEYAALWWKWRTRLNATCLLVSATCLVGFVVQGFANEGYSTDAAWLHLGFLLLMAGTLAYMGTGVVFRRARAESVEKAEADE